MKTTNDRLFGAALVLLLSLVGGSDSAVGATATSSFTVTGTVTAMCTISATGLSFNYDPVGANAGAAQPATAQGQLTLACTKGSSPSIGLDAGANAANAPSGSPRAMKMTIGATSTYLGYDLRWPGTTTSWTTASPYVPSAPTSKAARVFNMDGIVPGNQDVGVGTYNDTVTATVNF